MLPSRQQPSGPLTRCIREALESAVSPAGANNILAEALKRASLRAVPEDTEAFRVFCEGPFRTVALSAMGEDAQEVFERLGHVLRTATNDPSALVPPSERKSGTHVAPGREAPSIASAAESGSSLRRPELRAGSPAPAGRTAPIVSPTAPTIGAMPAVRVSPPGDPSPSAAARFAPLPPTPTPVRSLHPTRDGAPRRAPTAVLVVTMDAGLIRSVESELAAYCRVKLIGSVADLAAAGASAGERCVVVIDTAMPSIDVPKFVGLMAMLPREARVVLWGVAPRQQQRLATLFPQAANWIASGTSELTLGRFVLGLAY